MRSNADRPRRDLLSWAWIVAGPVALFGASLARGEVLFWGTPLLQFTPWRLYALEAIRRGELPLWNRLVGMGAPLLANYQSALLYPPNWLLLVLGVAWGQGVLVAAHLVLAGLGMVLLARRLGMGALGQVICGLAYSLSGYLVARAGFLSINAAGAWLPWVMLATERLAEAACASGGSRQTARHALGLSCILALQWLSGHAQTSWYTMVLATIWLGWRCITTQNARSSSRIVIGFLAAGVLAGALAAVQLLPTGEYWIASQRLSQLNREFALSYSFWPWRLTGLVMPDLFGTPVRGNYWGFGNFWEDAIYIGTLPFLLACAQGVRALRGRGEHVAVSRLLLGVACGSLLLALGANTPVFPWLYDHIPTFAAFQAPTRWTLLLVFCLTLLAGWGAEAWRPPTGRALYWTRLGTAGAAAIGFFAWLGSIALGDVQPTFVQALARMGVWLGLAGALSLLQPARQTAWWTGGVCGVVILDLVVAGWGLNPFAPAAVYEPSAAVRGRFGLDGRVYMPPQIEERAKFDSFFRFDNFRAAENGVPVRLAGLPNTLVLDGVSSANNFDPLVPARYAAWMEALSRLPLEQQVSLLRLMGVTWRAEACEGSPTCFVPVRDSARWRLYAAAHWVATDVEARQAVMALEFDPTQDLLLEGPSPSEDLAGSAGGTVEMIDESWTGNLEARVDSRSGAWLLLADTWFPGWRVAIDGRQAKAFPADSLFRAVWVPAGAHKVSWEYRPNSFAAGLVISLTGLVVLGGLGIRCRRD